MGTLKTQSTNRQISEQLGKTESFPFENLHIYIYIHLTRSHQILCKYFEYFSIAKVGRKFLFISIQMVEKR